ncbi:MAG TPA: ATP-binding protein [Gaiellaceae bacterium]|nr:ATP-binding protein [Gaiellaceae bacterium]
MNRLLHPRLALKFGLALLVIVVGALGIVYLAVVPRLESRLVNTKIHELETARPTVARAFENSDPATTYDALARAFQSTLGARVVVLQQLHASTLRDIADSNPLGTGNIQADPIARAALDSRRVARGRVKRDGQDRGEVAFPITSDTVVLLSTPLKDALANVTLVRRTLIFAGLAALFVSLLGGVVAAWRFSGRIRRLEEASGRIAAGDFEQPVVDPVEDEIGELARAFDSMRLRLAQLEHARREFIANASHELRTPLFSLGGFLELIVNEELDERERAEFVDEMSAQVQRLTKLATDLLDLSRLDAGQLAVSRTEVDIAATARTVTEEFRALAEASGHVLAAKTDEAFAQADEQRVLQIGRILLENAIRHTPAGTSVLVTAGRDDGHAVLAVRDDGPGVPGADQARIFDRFYRADGGKASGSGLGLAIASELAARMEGSIELQSEPGETVFALVLPLSDRAFSREIDTDLAASLPSARA